MSGLNSHFVSRFLTTPWEHGQRRLSYFDFEAGCFGSQSSETLFALRGTNTQEVEERLNSVIETPVSQAMARLTDSQPDSEELLEWPLFRAASLRLMLQPTRAAEGSEHSERLETTVMRSDPELDELAKQAQALYQLGRITIRTDVPLLYPAAGFFPLVAKGASGSYEAAIALPVARRHVFVAVPRSLDWESATAQWSVNGAAPVANASVGTSNRVVVPLAAINGVGPEKAIEFIRELRAANSQLIGLALEFNGAIVRLNAECGLS